MHLTLLILITATSLYSQISGSVVNAKTNQPIAGVNITGGNMGTAADNEGRFSITVQEGDELTFSHIGYSIISPNEIKFSFRKRFIKFLFAFLYKNFIFLSSLDNVTCFSKKELFFLYICLIGNESKNSLPRNIIGP